MRPAKVVLVLFENDIQSQYVCQGTLKGQNNSIWKANQIEACCNFSGFYLLRRLRGLGQCGNVVTLFAVTGCSTQSGICNPLLFGRKCVTSNAVHIETHAVSAKKAVSVFTWRDTEKYFSIEPGVGKLWQQNSATPAWRTSWSSWTIRGWTPLRNGAS